MFGALFLYIIIEIIISNKISKKAGAIFSLIVTTIILIWGTSVFLQGDIVALIGIPLTAPIFYILCIIWFIFDIRSIKKAIAIEKELKTPIEQIPLNSLPDINDSIGLTAYNSTDNKYLGKITSIDIKAEQCVIRNDFGKDIFKPISDVNIKK